MNIVEKNHAKRKERRKLSAEDFTPSYLVNQILDKMEQYHPDIFTNPDKTFIDPACGNGNLLIEVLKRKLQHTNPVQAVSTIYGCDIFDNNIAETRIRLFNIINDLETSRSDKLKVILYLFKNLVSVNTDKFPNGSVDYLQQDTSDTFNNTSTKKRCEEILTRFENMDLSHYSEANINNIKNIGKKQEPKVIKKEDKPVSYTIDQFIE